MAETMLEKVARAAFKEAASKKHGFWYEGMEWEDLPDLQAAFMDITRAAVEALREPTEEMVRHGASVTRDPDGWADPDTAAASYRLMIDAILKEEGNG